MVEYLGTFRHEIEKVYYLNKLGRERVKSEVVRKKTPQIQHFLLRNQLWIHLGTPRTWQNEVKIKLDDVSIICDAKYTAKGGIPVFIEVDCSQSQEVNRRKIEKYRKMQEKAAQPFHLLWITELESRKPALQELCKGIPGRVYTLREIK